MEVELYVYDLTHGMARQMSQQLLGFKIDAVYHTSLVFNGIEYFFGAGVQTCYAGTTHHGQPMEKIRLGTTQLPLETILEYLESLKQIYTPESYDLFAHNCNNFTNDFAMFLIGKGIPDHITSLPRRVLETPFGRMLQPQIDASMRKVTQAPVPQQNVPPAKAVPVATQTAESGTTNGISLPKAAPYGKVFDVSSLSVLDKHLQGAAQTALTIFFTSTTCAPCKLAYPMYDRLAGEFSHAAFIKIDINSAQDVASRYQIRATPTFMTFSTGKKVDEWSGADPNLLKTNVERVIHQTFPPHPHTHLRLPTLQFGSMKPVTYSKVPPLEKLMSKLGSEAKDEALTSLKTFIQKRSADAREATLPDLDAVGQAFRGRILNLPLEVRFAAVDLLRCAMVDPRVAGFFAEEKTNGSTLTTLVRNVNEVEDCPHNLRLVTIHLACNLFSSSLYNKEIVKPDNPLAHLLIQLVTSSLLDPSHPTTRVAASWLGFNLAVLAYRTRREASHEALPEGQQVELAASLLEALGSEDNVEAVKGQLLALGYLMFYAPQDGEVMDLAKALDAGATVGGTKGHEALAREVAQLL
ncbi:hypothetical protein B0A50_03621 [Salinomyces thailandicus]|uniref:Thioredoxin n=1 Tax=Salinomyces thailandicus TaxID=706561 RepID=A0A4U0U2A7_9PEZI|nr:hypothetical protein B0A50_03621 [Salinomyces thailandica]